MSQSPPSGKDPRNRFKTPPPVIGAPPPVAPDNSSVSPQPEPKNRFGSQPDLSGGHRTASTPVSAPATPDPRNVPKPVLAIPYATLRHSILRYGKPIAIGALLLVSLLILTHSRNGGSDQLSDDVLTRLKSATVLIDEVDPNSGNVVSSTSGFVVGDGATILTNRHAVANASPTNESDPNSPYSFEPIGERYVTFLSGTSGERRVKVAEADIQISDSGKTVYSLDELLQSDLAVIHIPKDAISSLQIKPLEIGDTSELKESAKVWLCGFPERLPGLNGAHPTASVQMHDVVNLYRDPQDNHATLLQLGGSGTHGNSGGPVVNADGVVVGVFDQRPGAFDSLTRAIATRFVKSFLTSKTSN